MVEGERKRKRKSERSERKGERSREKDSLKWLVRKRAGDTIKKDSEKEMQKKYTEEGTERNWHKMR